MEGEETKMTMGGEKEKREEGEREGGGTKSWTNLASDGWPFTSVVMKEEGNGNHERSREKGRDTDEG